MSETPTRRTRSFRFGAHLGRSGPFEAYLAQMFTPSAPTVGVLVRLLGSDPKVLPDLELLRLKTEAVRALRVPTVAGAFGVVQLAGQPALVTQDVGGEPLSAVLQELPPRAALELVGSLAATLHHLWDAPIAGGAPMHLAHGGLGPAVVSVGPDGAVVVADFGFARDLRSVDARYLAPEAFSRRDAQPTADVYGLGCILYEALAHERLAEGVSPRQLVELSQEPHRHAAFVRERLSGLRATVSPQVFSLLFAILGAKSGARPPAGTLASTLQQLAGSAPGASLQQVMAGRGAPAGPQGRGPLTGQTWREGGAAPEPPPRPAPGRRRIRPLALAGQLAALGCLSLVGLSVAAVAGQLWWSAGMPLPELFVPDVSMPEVPADAPGAASDEPGPAGVAVEVEGRAERLVLVSGGETYQPGAVPPGRYLLRLDAGRGLKSVAEFDVRPGEDLHIRCVIARRVCELERR